MVLSRFGLAAPHSLLWDSSSASSNDKSFLQDCTAGFIWTEEKEKVKGVSERAGDLSLKDVSCVPVCSLK